MKKLLCALLVLLSPLIYARGPELMLLSEYQQQDIRGWTMSEKLDGVRAYWDGKQLFGRSGLPFVVPDYFTQDFPPFAIDGELFSAQLNFAEISSISRSYQDKGWNKLKLYVFDVPEEKGPLPRRLDKLAQYLAQYPAIPVRIIEQIPIRDRQHMYEFLQRIEKRGGEGIVVRNPAAPYEAKRSNQILKLKTAADEECRVIAHHKGKGRLAEMLGALSCKNERGTFRIGSGFSDEERRNPPPIGSLISYKYRGLTNKGKPRFATFWRIKEEENRPHFPQAE
ncbi:DNA ligase-1 [Mesocricetibacter intestinalis]|uniref:DNA ligase-1 n=1 Tax=Mesocricetibacter intestinalis TaxID=1521930 RepID=A0A4R6VAR4_9PAST|nr:DNA ligase [Mesocricetibacter intestinalis]TDQ57364.1 DNA ligase-1 [Mesocricetibacter intestinalis]